VYPWKHADPPVDALAASVFGLVATLQKEGCSRREIFTAIWERACAGPLPNAFLSLSNGIEVPHLDEPWYCCAEPLPAQVPLV
jgi:hypothetical protein